MSDAPTNNAPGSAGQNGAHTPGPYHRDGLTVYALDERKNANRFSALVQEGYLHHTRHEKIRTPQEELEATAQLFAAAPELLEAVLNARGLIDAPVARRKHQNDPFYAGVVASLRTAIAKATGEGV